MFDKGFFQDRCNIYRPTHTASSTGEVIRSYPGTPTSSAVPCLFTPRAGVFRQGQDGLTLAYDAELRVQSSLDIRAEQRGYAPDKVIITSHEGRALERAFAVASVVSESGLYKTVMLREIPYVLTAEIIGETTPPVTLSHERGGLEADVSAYNGLLKISGGVTSYIADLSTNWTTAYGWGDHAGLYDILGTAADLVANHNHDSAYLKLDATNDPITGALTANGGAVFNETGADVNFRIEGDTEPNLFFLDSSANAIGIGIADPARRLHVFKDESAQTALLVFHIANNSNASGPGINLWRHRGTLNNKAVPQDGDVLGAIYFQAWDGGGAADFYDGAQIRGQADGTISLGSTPGKLTFLTCPSGSNNATNRMTIDATGTLVINDDGISTADVRMEGDTEPNLFFLDSSADQVVFGSDAGSAPSKVEIVGADNSTALIVKVNATQANITAADTFVDFRSTTGSEGGIAGTAVAGVLAYNTFLGAHYVQVIGDRAKLQPGMLLENTGERADKPTVQERDVEVTDIPEIELEDGVIEKGEPQKRMVKRLFKAAAKSQTMKARICQTRQSKAAYGIWLGQDKEGRDLCGCVGLGLARVVNKGKDIGLHDYLISSDVLGGLERQDNDVLRNYTVGKAMESVVWRKNEKDRQIVVTFHCG